MGGCSWGKFSVREGGLEGESPVFQEGALSLQGLSLSPSKVFLTSRRESFNQRAELGAVGMAVKIKTA